MFDFYGQLISWVKVNNFSLVVKAHPRMKLEFIEYFIKNDIAIFKDTVPNTNIVIGHYSSLLSFWGGHGRMVLCFELQGHDIDYSISSWAYVFKDFNKLDLNVIECNIRQCHLIYGKPDMKFNFKKLIVNK